MSEAPEIQLFRFGDFELDGDSLELRQGGEVVALRPQAAKVLRLLLENAGRLVSRDEIRDRVWGPDSGVDFDHSLHTAIRQVRAALGESGEEARLVQTYPRRGYRFEAEVEVQRRPSSLHATAPSGAPVIVPALSDRRSLPRMAVAAVVVLVVAALAWSWWPAGEPGPTDTRERIALAPFRILTDASPAMSEFTDGLDAELAGAFARLSDDHTMVLAQPVGLTAEERQALAESQAADLLLSGAVRSSEGVLRVTVQLLRVSDGAQLWADTFEALLDGSLDVQTDLAEQIVTAVHGAVHGLRP